MSGVSISSLVLRKASMGAEGSVMNPRLWKIYFRARRRFPRGVARQPVAIRRFMVTVVLLLDVLALVAWRPLDGHE